MNFFSILLAQVDDGGASLPRMDAGTRDGLIVGLSVFMAALIGIVFALLLRKKKKRHHHHSHLGRRQASGSSQSQNGSAEDGAEHSESRRHHRRREHRPRNPTLAETGGLPPIRQEPPADPTP